MPRRILKSLAASSVVGHSHATDVNVHLRKVDHSTIDRKSGRKAILMLIFPSRSDAVIRNIRM